MYFSRVHKHHLNQMLTPADMDAVNWKLTMRKKIVDMIRSLIPMADPTLQFYSLIQHIPSCDFTKLFERLLVDDGVPTESVHSDSYDNIIWEENDSENDDCNSFVNELMHCYDANPSLYMSFLSFIFNRNKVLAKKMFQTTNFKLTDCIYNDNCTQDDFETVLAYDVALGSDLFRNKKCKVLYNICGTAIIPVIRIDKMKKLVLAYGPDIMLWTSNNSIASSQTNVNVFLYAGYIMNTEKWLKVDETLDFLINSCPLALKQSVDVTLGGVCGKVNAYTIVLERCDSETNPRHQMIVHNVFQYFYLADLHTIYNENGQTFQELVAESGNSLVLGYLEKKFDIIIPKTCG